MDLSFCPDALHGTKVEDLTRQLAALTEKLRLQETLMRTNFGTHPAELRCMQLERQIQILQEENESLKKALYAGLLAPWSTLNTTVTQIQSTHQLHPCSSTLSGSHYSPHLLQNVELCGRTGLHSLLLLYFKCLQRYNFVMSPNQLTCPVLLSVCSSPVPEIIAKIAGAFLLNKNEIANTPACILLPPGASPGDVQGFCVYLSKITNNEIAPGPTDVVQDVCTSQFVI